MMSSPQTLAALLGNAWTQGAIALPAASLPATPEQACEAQALTLARQGWRIGAWKVGAKPGVAPQAAPLPPALPSPARLPLARPDRLLGLELEIAFRLGRDFRPGEAPRSDEEALAGIDGVCATIELVASRLRAEPAPDKLAQLADLQNHGALVAGACLPYDPALPWLNPPVRWTFEDEDIAPPAPANPAGDPRSLLAWTMQHALGRGLRLPAGTLITAGTYTGLYLPVRPGTARGKIAGLPPVTLTLV